jgi:hypothetical protein
MSLSPTLLAVALGVPAVAILASRLLPGARISLALARERREERRARVADMDLAAAYHTQLPPESRADALDDRTWQDLDLDEVFCSVDFTRSEPGRQYLYHLLRTPTFSRDRLDLLERAVRRLDKDPTATDRIRSSLRRLDDPRAARLVHLILGELPTRPALWWIFPLLTFGALACLALIVLWPRALVIWIAISVVNVGVQLFYRPRVAHFVPALHEIPAFLRAATELGSAQVDELAPGSRILGDGARRLGSLRRATTWLMFEPGQANEFVATLYEYVNLLFLFDVNAFVFTTETLRSSRTELRSMFDAIGYIDAVQSVVAWRDGLPRWAVPEFAPPGKQLMVQALVHPLLTEPVPNSLAVEDASVLITGSNMSGKTTFVRALGVNAVLAQTLNSTCADGWRAPMLRVRTSIGRSDSLIEGKSYYLAEVESVRALIDAKEDGEQHLFLLDEIFRGTNTVERVSAAAAVLAYLDRGPDLVVVATHDIELLDLLGDRYVAHHFREEIADGAVTFDYRIHDGPSSTRNAIALLEVTGYPAELVADARATLDWQHRREPRRS